MIVRPLVNLSPSSLLLVSYQFIIYARSCHTSLYFFFKYRLLCEHFVTKSTLHVHTWCMFATSPQDRPNGSSLWRPRRRHQRHCRRHRRGPRTQRSSSSSSSPLSSARWDHEKTTARRATASNNPYPPSEREEAAVEREGDCCCCLDAAGPCGTPSTAPVSVGNRSPVPPPAAVAASSPGPGPLSSSPPPPPPPIVFQDLVLILDAPALPPPPWKLPNLPEEMDADVSCATHTIHNAYCIPDQPSFVGLRFFGVFRAMLRNCEARTGSSSVSYKYIHTHTRIYLVGFFFVGVSEQIHVHLMFI